MASSAPSSSEDLTRKGGSPTATATASPSMATATRLPRPFKHPPAVLLLIYPVTLVLGSLFSVISPTARSAAQATTRSSGYHTHHHPDPLAPTIAAELNLSSNPVNYFARKDNIFNLYFVKIGWLWTTLAFTALLVSQPAYTASRARHHRPRRLAQAILRYTLVTSAWYLTTQWCFGPAIIDRSFVLTGGKCEEVERTPVSAAEPVKGLQTLVTGAACKAAGGAWTGGMDVSGHVFMLVLATAFLAFETYGAAAAATPSSPTIEVGGGGAGEKKRDGGSDLRDGTWADSEMNRDSSSLLRVWSLRFVWMVIGLKLWMLLMTAVWFHTFLEKVSRSPQGIPFTRFILTFRD